MFTCDYPTNELDKRYEHSSTSVRDRKASKICNPLPNSNKGRKLQKCTIWGLVRSNHHQRPRPNRKTNQPTRNYANSFAHLMTFCTASNRARKRCTSVVDFCAAAPSSAALASCTIARCSSSCTRAAWQTREQTITTVLR